MNNPQHLETSPTQPILYPWWYVALAILVTSAIIVVVMWALGRIR